MNHNPSCAVYDPTPSCCDCGLRWKESNEQKLIDICFHLTLAAATHPWFKDKSQEEIAGWVRHQLNECGYKVEPCGASHGKLLGKG